MGSQAQNNLQICFLANCSRRKPRGMGWGGGGGLSSKRSQLIWGQFVCSLKTRKEVSDFFNVWRFLCFLLFSRTCAVNRHRGDAAKSNHLCLLEWAGDELLTDNNTFRLYLNKCWVLIWPQIRKKKWQYISPRNKSIILKQSLKTSPSV